MPELRRQGTLLPEYAVVDPPAYAVSTMTRCLIQCTFGFTTIPLVGCSMLNRIISFLRAKNSLSRIVVLAVVALVSFAPMPVLADEAQAKLPVPSVENLAAAKKLIGDVYKDEYAAAQNSTQEWELAKKLLASAKESRSDPIARYALLEIVVNIASGIGDIDTAEEAIAILEQEYAIDTLQMRARLLRDVSKTLRTPNQQKPFVGRISLLVEEAVAADRYDLAGPLADLALDLARKAHSQELAKGVLAAKRELDGFEKEYNNVKAALETLQSDPVEPAANLQVGRYRCFVKNDWENGIPMLALGSDAELKRLALLELKPEPVIDDWVTLGDGWWKQAAELNGTQAWNVAIHSSFYYQQALSALAGLEKARVEKILEEIADLPPARPESWISRDATYVVSSRYNNVETLPSLLSADDNVHGGPVRGSGASRYAFYTKYEHGARIVIDLGQVRRITRVQIVNRLFTEDEWRKDYAKWAFGRTGNLHLWVSSDASSKGQLVWSTKSPETGWDIRLQKPINGRYLTLGYPKDHKGQLHLCKVRVSGY